MNVKTKNCEFIYLILFVFRLKHDYSVMFKNKMKAS